MSSLSITNWVESFAIMVSVLTLIFAVYQYRESVRVRRFALVQELYAKLNDPSLGFDTLWSAAQEKTLKLEDDKTKDVLIAVLSEAHLLAEAFKTGIIKKNEILAVAYEFEMLAQNCVVQDFIKQEQKIARDLDLPRLAYPFTGLAEIRACWKKPSATSPAP